MRSCDETAIGAARRQGLGGPSIGHLQGPAIPSTGSPECTEFLALPRPVFFNGLGRFCDTVAHRVGRRSLALVAPTDVGDAIPTMDKQAAPWTPDSGQDADAAGWLSASAAATAL